VIPQVVLLHGAGADCARLSWKYVLPQLAQRFRVLSPDLPGHGGAPALPEPTTEAYARWLERYLEGIWAGQVALVGLSLGGALALGYALDHPHRVTRLVLVASYGLSRRVPYHGLLRVLLRSPLRGALACPSLRQGFALRVSLRFVVGSGAAVTRELVEDVRDALRRTDPGLFWRWVATEVRGEGVRTCYLDRLESLQVPVLLVHGDRDQLVPVRDAQAAALRIPKAKLVVLRGCGHWPPRERPAEVVEALGRFLSE
jgi:pimeloyl-ACP methyl ester carboxylesterase